MKPLKNIAPVFGALLLTYASPCTAGDNATFGTAAGTDITTGTDNTILGTLAGESVTTGTDNTLVGYEGGKGVTGNYNIMLGEDPSSAITSGGSNILIGNSLTEVTNSSSNQLDIGDTLYGTLGGSGTITAADNFTVLGTIIGNLFSGSGASLTNLNGSNISSGTVSAARLPTGTVITSTASPSQGDVLYYNGSNWIDLAAGTSGYFLETQGTGADPEWAAVSSGSGTVSSGTQYQMGYYASTGTTISGDSSIVTDSSGDLSLGSGSYQLDGYTVLAFPDGDTTSIAVGTSALAAQNVGGSENSALGDLALTSITGGYWNAAVGGWALEYSTNGFVNTAVGVLAMQGTSASPLVGAANTAVGGLALAQLGDGASNNTGMGSGAGASITTGTDNTLVGYAAGAGVTGNFNIMLGEDPYPGIITTGSSNILIGNSLTAVTDTSSNQLDIGDTIYGTLGGSGTVTVANNLNLGSGSYQLNSNTVLAFPDGDTTSIAVGTSALAAQNVGGSENSALGDLALTSITGGYWNAAVGGWALEYSTNGFVNTAVGVLAMQGTSASPLVGAANTAVGGLALAQLGDGASNNTGMGSGAGASITTGTDNTLVGYAAGAGVTGNFNIMLGEDPSPGAITTGSSNILIGNSLTEVTDTSSNQLDIGDTIYGTLGGSGNTNVAGTLTLKTVNTGTNADFLCMSSNGLVLRQTSACTISSRRFKENIEPLPSGLDEIMQLSPVTFNKRVDTTHPDTDVNAYRSQIGLIAENVADVDARAAIYEQDGKTPKSYRQESVTALLVKAVQEQQKEIDSMKAELKIYRSRHTE